MAAARKTRNFHVWGRLNLEIGVDIAAESFNEATQKAHELQVSDFVDIQGEHCDSEMLITGVFENNRPCERGLKD